MPVAPCFDIDARIEQRRNMLPQRLRAAQIGNRNLRPTPPEEERRGKTRNTQPDDENLLAFELHERELNGNHMNSAFPFSRDLLASETKNAEDTYQNQSRSGHRSARDRFSQHPCAECNGHSRIDECVAGCLACRNVLQKPRKTGECQQGADEDQINHRQRRPPSNMRNMAQFPIRRR